MQTPTQKSKNVILYDGAGRPNVMTLIPKMRDKNGALHPAFIIDGKEVEELYVSTYLNSMIDGWAGSLPLQPPAVEVDYDRADELCRQKGAGWHLMTNAEWAALALFSRENGTLPHGNTYSGVYHGDHAEFGIRDGRAGGKTLTGSGPATWTHDHTPAGVHDLCGNVWEWVAGLRLRDGEIQIIPNNDAAICQGRDDQERRFAPVCAGDKPLYYSQNDDEEIEITTEPPEEFWDGMPFAEMTAAIEIPDIMKTLALAPEARDGDKEPGYIYVDTDGERLPLRGGHWLDAARAGVFNLDLSGARSLVSTGLGFRSAFVVLKSEI